MTIFLPSNVPAPIISPSSARIPKDVGAAKAYQIAKESSVPRSMINQSLNKLAARPALQKSERQRKK
jgi:hypothetical protein